MKKILLMLLVFLCLAFSACAPTIETDENIIRGFAYTGSTTVELEIGESFSAFFAVSAEGEFDTDDFQFVVSDSEALSVTLDKIENSKIYFTVLAQKECEATLYIKASDDTVESEKISFTVTIASDPDPDPNPDPNPEPDPEPEPEPEPEPNPEPKPEPEPEPEPEPDPKPEPGPIDPENPALTKPSFDVLTIPEYSNGGLNYFYINGNIPYFTKNQITNESYEYYSPLDSLGRVGTVVACIGKDLMPTDARKDPTYKPTGWYNNSYPFISGGYVYNRCHLIGWQLTGETNNKQNLLTGTIMLNVGTKGDYQLGMLDFENQVADYLKEFPENHVMYRVEPVFIGDNLLASGVIIEGFSVEDNGEGICFNVFIMNVQDGVIFDYATGENQKDPSYDTGSGEPEGEITLENCTYVINKSTKKIHLKTCRYATSTTNVIYTDMTLEELFQNGYSSANLCGTCKPQNAKNAMHFYYDDKRRFAA